MVAYLCPLCASYFCIKYVDMQGKYVDMQYSNVNMQHNFVDQQANCNLVRIAKKISKYQKLPTCDFQHARCYLFMWTCQINMLL